MNEPIFKFDELIFRSNYDIKLGDALENLKSLESNKGCSNNDRLRINPQAK
jgi:hypothetical protein